ncbi:hypothetical protein [Methylocaldum sp.]|uniref:hypothetical protein n=1 Tax=Methylocaldum sp. TaxID=1969727 RepID=UPI002D51153B|nr:hypothetical protein [Methylocaldum sp.]HYE37595.1 hypothetical protein [Methylocaldum sp.]
MHHKEHPVIPFTLDIESVAAWLDGLPVANTRECCRVLYPVLQALNAASIEPRLRFAILEKCRATVSGLDKGLLPYFLDRSFPLDGKTRKIASLCSRFHSELALGYRQTVEAGAFAEAFKSPEQAVIVGRVFEYYANSLLRAAQIYEAPPSAFWPSIFGLFRLTEERGLCHSTLDDNALGTVSVTRFFKVVLLFGLAAPNRLGQRDIQRLFDVLATHAELVRIESTPVDSGARAVLCFDCSGAGSLMPVPAPAPVNKPGLRFLFVERLLSEFRSEIRAGGKPEENPLTFAFPRLGDRLPCQSELTARRAVPSLGIETIAATVRRVEAHRTSGASSTPWSNLDQLELAPLSSDLRSEALGSKSTGTFAAALVSRPGSKGERLGGGFGDMRSAKVYRSELPGFYMVDSGGQTFRIGDLLALNTDDEIIQVGAVRCGQIHDGQFCYNFELLGNNPRSVRFRGERPGSDMQKALLFKTASDAPNTLITPPVKLRGGDAIIVEWGGGKRIFRIAKLLEANSTFCHIALAAEPSV